jgi:hypothetical protein
MPSSEPTVPLTAARADKTGPYDLPNWMIRFVLFQAGAFGSSSFHVQTHFGDSVGESTTSSTSSMNGGSSGNNGSDLDKDNILEPTFDTLTEEGHQVFEDYITGLRELFLSHCKVTWQGTVLRDTTPIIFNKPEVRPDPSPSHNDIQFIIDSALERQAKSIDELLHMLIEEQNGKKLDATSVNPSSTCAISFTQTNPHTSGPSTGGTSMPNPSAQPVNHFHSRTTIEGSATTFGTPQQTMARMFGEGYTHTAPCFCMPNLCLAPYTSGYNGLAYPNTNGNYQAPYTTVAYTNPIPLPGSSLGFLPNHNYQNAPRFNAYGQPKANGFGYETPPQFPFRPQPIDMMPAQATA